MLERNGYFGYRTPPRIQERKDAKKRHILDSAAKVFAIKGYYNTNIRDILDEAGISTGSFYFYFNTKEELFEILYNEMIKTYVSVLQDAVATMTDDAGNVEASIAKAITLSLQTFQENKELARIMLISSMGLNLAFEKKRIAEHQKISLIFEEIFQSLLQKKSSGYSMPKWRQFCLPGRFMLSSCIGFRKIHR